MRLKILSISLTSVIMCFILSSCSNSAVEITDLSYYKENKLSTLFGGEYAEKFIPEYSSLDNDPTIKFYYFDGRKKSSFFHKYFISFVVECCADNDKAKNDYDNFSADNIQESIDYFLKIKKSERNVYNFVYKNSETNRIKYIVLYEYGNKEEDPDPAGTLAWNCIDVWDNYEENYTNLYSTVE